MIAIVFRNGFFRFLKPGFQHCFLIDLTTHTMVEKPLLSLRPRVTPDAFTLPQLLSNYGQRGYTVVLLHAPSPSTPLPIPRRALTCVTLVKAVLGIDDLRVQTPYQLYKSIT